MRSRTNHERRILIAVLTFLISLSSLVSGTFAWFASASFLEVDRFKITVGDQERIEFGLVVPDGLAPELGVPGEVVYFSNLTQEVLQSYGYYNPWLRMKPVSSMYQSLWLDGNADLKDEAVFNAITPQFRTHYNANTNTKEAMKATEGYYQFELFLRSNYDVDVYLDPSSSVRPNLPKNRNTASALGMDLDKLNKIVDFTRVSFLTEDGYKIWEPNTSLGSTTKFGGRLDVLRYDSYFDYDYLTKKELMFGEYNSDDFLVYNEEARVLEVEHFTSFSALTSPEVSPLNIAASEANGLVIAKEKSYTTAQLSSLGNTNYRLVQLRPNRPTRIVLSVYAEGWDLDATSDSQYASFLLNLVLTGTLVQR